MRRPTLQWRVTAVQSQVSARDWDIWVKKKDKPEMFLDARSKNSQEGKSLVLHCSLDLFCQELCISHPTPLCFCPFPEVKKRTRVSCPSFLFTSAYTNFFYLSTTTLKNSFFNISLWETIIILPLVSRKRKHCFNIVYRQAYPLDFLLLKRNDTSTF